MASDTAGDRLVRLVARRIAQQRRAAGLTQEAFAEALDTSVQYVSKIETGENLTLQSISKIAKALHVAPIELLQEPVDSEKPKARRTKRPASRTR